MLQEFKDWAEARGIKMQLIAKDAHHQLGMLERNHQVRREQITIYGATHKKDTLRQAGGMTCSQRNRLRNVKGYSPTQLVLRRSAEVLRESSWARARSEWRGSRSGTFGERNRPSRGQWAPILARRRDKRPTLAPSHSRIGSARFLSNNFKVG